MNRLVEIRIEDLPKLRDLYKAHKTEASAYNMIQNYIDWFEKDPSLDFKFYSLNGDWSDGTFVLKEHHNTILCNTVNESQDRLEAALHCLDKDKAYAFSGFPDRILPTVDMYFKQWGGVPSKQTTTIWQHIPKETALQFDTEPPEGITLSPLRREHVDTINSLWPHRFAGSEKFVSRLISMNMNVGAYDKDGNLTAWILQIPTGALGFLHVQDEHKRRGLGSLLVRMLSKMFAQVGLEVVAPVVDTNTPSRQMFKKLNFKEIDKAYWWAM